MKTKKPHHNKGRKRPDLSKRNKENIRYGKDNPKWKGGITKDRNEYTKKWKTEIFEKKAGRKKPDSCELCGAIGRICFDHDHNTDEFRGWLCVRCNVTLGFVKDSEELLLRMANYIKLSKQ